MQGIEADMKVKSGQLAYNAICKAWRSIGRVSLTKEPFDPPTLLPGSDINANAPVKDTVLYLAYGSNLSAETFKGIRGIKPLSQVNVHVPELELCFNLPGIPYNEPCFANTRLRTVKRPWTNDNARIQWQKGLVGVVYEVTKDDFAKILATEGGGSAYQDVIVLCFEIPPGTNIIQPIPTSRPFAAHTLFCPSLPPTKPGEPSKGIGRPARPDPDYAQPSARYLKLITDGAAEHKMPLEYENYLLRLQPYTITSTKQKIGQALFQILWMPLLLVIFGLGRIFADENGKVPAWLGFLSNLVMSGIWTSYDKFFKPVFGDGERTKEEEDDSEHGITESWNEKKPLLGEV